MKDDWEAARRGSGSGEKKAGRASLTSQAQLWMQQGNKMMAAEKEKKEEAPAAADAPSEEGCSSNST
jgi:hypothetical protein